MKKRLGWNRLTDEQILLIQDTYKSLRSIRQTAQYLNHAQSTVQKYVQHLSYKDIHSRYSGRKVVQLDPLTGRKLCTYGNASAASKNTGIASSSISKALNGKLMTAGGYAWEYLSSYSLDSFKPRVGYFVSYSKQIDRLLFR